ncbi:phosphatidylethanolamine N-methyltransferase-like [Liolophura sinensis]|uniref:phosphatidylethanolamine N-methyltransferase-like n=1 Tax=Liolophura sinensis TaxID=3198878 RepID=UPI003158FF08
MKTNLLCCGDESFIDFSKVEIPSLTANLSDHNLWIAVISIIFNPIFWNIVARSEYKTHRLTSFFGSPYRGCVVLASTIIVLGIFRDWRFHLALQSQPRWFLLQQTGFLWLGYFLILTGTILVFTSFWAMGFYATFLGDYFGLLLDDRITSFPFNIIDNPMYWGSTLNFLGTALIQCSQTGLLLTTLVAIMYKIAILYEGPFTERIYSRRYEKKLW